MTKPKMILFDYGQTLGNEEKFNGIKGTAAVMEHAVENERGLTPEEVQAEAEAINTELGRFDPAKRSTHTVEIPNHMFTAYLYESVGVKIDLTAPEIDRVFWNAASPAKPSDGIEEFLEFLNAEGIRTAVLSNITYNPEVVKERINTILPDNRFEFIIATSEYLFRKPHKRIFDFALMKAGLKPEEVWYVGDNYVCDVEGARNAGMTPIWYKGAVDFAQDYHDDVTTIYSWKELREIIEKL
ncbi:MAG: HAD-IIIA family hydrolase [Lachnospiraceae bacterium]|nr:HAD-IIIA family hydrolase [Lachnospiraceae bacterium]